jgi:hypothetical protein
MNEMLYFSLKISHAFHLTRPDVIVTWGYLYHHKNPVRIW